MFSEELTAQWWLSIVEAPSHLTKDIIVCWLFLLIFKIIFCSLCAFSKLHSLIYILTDIADFGKQVLLRLLGDLRSTNEYTNRGEYTTRVANSSSGAAGSAYPDERVSQDVDGSHEAWMSIKQRR